ncbi:sensor histidine kinase [Streptosporangium sp. NBC_01756]|uniref:sensor histidine kinase n=1 Tax=Streptosporangium sp. NBC_01756 TaxID=2975950 RepID=UPI002DDBD21A|nr:nitrate- and nitrite sensing domain-containing protein [Streptosporangium sp. NBC_01756]WSC82858.1 nitrate- and nitrite sensing domain-containing protein [Streptosporangium sp. NBC_01756]
MASSKSIRFKISVLVAIPLASLVALWGFAATVTVGDSVSLLEVTTLYDSFGAPGDTLNSALQREHLLSAEYMASRSDANRATLAGQRVVTDQARERFRKATTSASAQSAMSAEMRARFDELTSRVNALDTVRAKIDSGRIGPIALVNDFSTVPDALNRLFTAMSLSNDLPLYRQSRGLSVIVYAKDFLGRERALAAGVLARGRPLAGSELRLFTQLSTKRLFLMDQALPELAPELRRPFDELTDSQLYDRFTGLEERLLAGARVSPTDWRAASDALEAAYQRSVTAAGVALYDRATPDAVATFAKAGIAGVLGLVAVIASLMVSYRVGRGLTRELAGLRGAAAELAEVRLPQVMEKLRRGERVDMAAEAPSLKPLGSTAEVHDVAAAFDSVQHRAVNAAVEQARLRDGVAQSFRNLARRSQSLLQRQLKLLDGMQKQAEDPDALENLFRLDHLTTRMRRHAEGLVILSGGAAGRKWRSSVLMEDVLRGAAAQVEDYARVRIYPMPGTTLVGSAVADMMHLFAEIIENATVFSPPGGEVSVRGELVGRGFTIEIEDRGLGLTAEKRAAINERLASPPELDPAETDRLGFAVVGLLAARYKIGVTLRTSPYGGTGVVILLPESLLGDPEPVEPAEPALREITGGAEPVERLRAVAPRPPAESPAPAPADLWKSPRRVNGGLPRRVRQAAISPRLRQDPSPAAEPAARSPEEARALLSSLQAGWRRGRSDGEDGGGEP